jgi:hypothetical protein
LVVLAAAMSLTAGCTGLEGDEENLGEVSDALSFPSQVTYIGRDLDGSELDSLESEEHQGLAACPNFWIWTTVNKIMKVPRGGSLTSPLTGVVEDIPEPFRSMGYNHFGDGECTSGRYFVPLTGTGLDPIELEYSEDFVLQAFGRTDTSISAINPVDGLMYAQTGMKLKVFNRAFMRKFRWDPASCPLSCWKQNEYDQSFLPQLRTVNLIGRGGDAFWSASWTQGASFSENGVLYVLADYAKGGSNWAGAHMFDVHAFTDDDAVDVPVPGDEDNGILVVHYDGDVDIGSLRYEELEGITVYTLPGESKHHVKVTLMLNEALDDDDITVYHWTTDETPRAAVNDYWTKLPAIW